MLQMASKKMRGGGMKMAKKKNDAVWNGKEEIKMPKLIDGSKFTTLV